MLIRCGYDIAFECSQTTSILLHLNVSPERGADLLSPDCLSVSPHLPLRSYTDTFGNTVMRLEAPAGVLRIQNSFIIRDSGAVDTPAPDTPMVPVSALPDAVLQFLLPSRYVDSDLLSEFAWANFANRGSVAEAVRAIVDFVHGHIRFDYQLASVFRTASGGFGERVGVCRDFAHLGVALCRAINIPARYCTGYLGDIGVPIDPAPMDFSAWFEVFIDGAWYTFDARHRIPRIGRIVMARGRDAADVAISTSFGLTNLVKFEVTTEEIVEAQAADVTPKSPSSRSRSAA